MLCSFQWLAIMLYSCFMLNYQPFPANCGTMFSASWQLLLFCLKGLQVIQHEPLSKRSNLNHRGVCFIQPWPWHPLSFCIGRIKHGRLHLLSPNLQYRHFSSFSINIAKLQCRNVTILYFCDAELSKEWKNNLFPDYYSIIGYYKGERKKNIGAVPVSKGIMDGEAVCVNIQERKGKAWRLMRKNNP